MNIFFNIINMIVSSRYYMTFYMAIILLFTLFQGRIISRYVVKRINKILSSEYKIVEELKNELIKETKLEDNLTEYYNCLTKSRTYLMMGIGSLAQLIGLLVSQSVDNISVNICMITIVISFMEFRDNRRLAKKIKMLTDADTSKILETYIELDKIALEDFVFDNLIEDGIINEEKRLEFIKNKNKTNCY